MPSVPSAAAAALEDTCCDQLAQQEVFAGYVGLQRAAVGAAPVTCGL